MSDKPFFHLDGAPRGRVYHWRVVDGNWRLVFGDRQTLVIKPLRHPKVNAPAERPTVLESVLARLTDYVLACTQAEDEKGKAEAIAGLKHLAKIGTGRPMANAKAEALYGMLHDGLFKRMNHAELNQVLELVAWFADPANKLAAEFHDSKKRKEPESIAYMDMLANLPSTRAQAMRDRLFKVWHTSWAQWFDKATRQQIDFVAKFEGAATTITCPVSDYIWDEWDAEEECREHDYKTDSANVTQGHPPSTAKRIEIKDDSGAIVGVTDEDYRSLTFYGVSYTFTVNQAVVVKRLCEAYPHPLSGESIFDSLAKNGYDQANRRLGKVFREKIPGTKKKRPHPAWKTVVKSGPRKGLYHLGVKNPIKSPPQSPR